jgi:hypothetical protein
LKLRLGAAVLLAALVPLTAVTAPSPARAGEVDITPPEVGSCHALTLADEDAASDPDPAVDCAGQHTSVTVAVLEFAEPPNWSDFDALGRVALRRCYPRHVEALGGSMKVVRRSAHISYYFIPTRAQRDAGAAWMRCDVVLYGGDRLMPLPDELALGDLPLPDARARCLKGRAADYALTVCTRAHQYRARYSVRFPYDAWPGVRTIRRHALRQCDRRVDGQFLYEYPPSRLWWHLGYRHAICLPKTTN